MQKNVLYFVEFTEVDIGFGKLALKNKILCNLWRCQFWFKTACCPFVAKMPHAGADFSSQYYRIEKRTDIYSSNNL